VRARRPISAERRFALLQREEFTCAFCGAYPGNDRLNIAHIYPHSLGGTDHDNNLVVACDRCNNGTGTLVAIPRPMLAGGKDGDGWLIWKRWGSWVLSWHPERIAERDPDDFLRDLSCCQLSLTFAPPEGRHHNYHITLDRVHEQDWLRHLERKSWLTSDDLEDFQRGLAFARTLVEACA
jgi:hypothetical protein